MGLDARKTEAARIIAGGGKQSEAARSVGVDRSTIGRWAAEPEFQALIATLAENQVAVEGLESLVPQAMKTIEEALAGKATASAGRVALEVIKAAALIAKTEAGSESTLETRLAELDARNARQSD